MTIHQYRQQTTDHRKGCAGYVAVWAGRARRAAQVRYLFREEKRQRHHRRYADAYLRMRFSAHSSQGGFGQVQTNRVVTTDNLDLY